MAFFFVTCRSIRPDGGFGDVTDIVRYLAIPEDVQEPLAAHEFPSTGPRQTRGARWAQGLLASVPRDPAKANEVGKPTGDVLFLVHGFNQNSVQALNLHRLVAEGLKSQGWRGVVVSFDWPSDGSVAAYIDDRSKARATADLLTSGGIALFVRMSQAPPPGGCDVAVHVLAHSMGAYVVRLAFDHASDDQPSRGVAWQINQMAFVAGDVSAGSMTVGNALSQELYGHVGRFTNYSNPRDEALQISNAKRVFTAPRVGRVGLADPSPDIACNVDGEAVWLATGDTNLFDSHGFWFGQPAFYRDLKLTLDGAIDRDAMPTRTLLRHNRSTLNLAS